MRNAERRRGHGAAEGERKRGHGSAEAGDRTLVARREIACRERRKRGGERRELQNEDGESDDARAPHRARELRKVLF